MSVRRLLVILGMMLAMVAFVIWLRRGEADYLNFPPKATGPWVAFGDSLTEGYGAASGQDYPAVLAQRLGVPIMNSGRSGDTTADGLKRFEDLARLQPQVVLLCLGGNDSLNREASKQTFANLGTMIDCLHQEGTFVVLIGIRSASLRDRNEKHFKKLAREKRVFYLPDMLRGLAFKPVYMSDAIHPNDEGYRRIAERLEKALRPLLPKLTNAIVTRQAEGG
jgi:lysophospholipase L1-like esterase